MDHTHHSPVEAKAAGLSMGERMSDFFSQYGFMPHGHCYLWKPWLVGLHVVSDFLIGAAYVIISITLYGLVKKTQIGFNRIVLCFGIFIGACGLTHFMEIWNLWNADYWWAAWVKVVTAIASVGTGMYLYRLREPLTDLANTAKLAERQRLDLEKLNQKLQKTLAATTEDFDAIANSIPQLAWKANADGYITWYNQRWYEYTGTTPDEMMGWGWQKVHHPDHVNHVTDKFKKAVESGISWEDTFPLRSKTGEYRWFLSRALPIRNAQGDITHWFGTNTDITVDLSRKKALEESEQKFKTIANAMPQMIWSTLPDGFHDYYNVRWYEYTGVPVGSTDGDEWSRMFHPDDQERTLNMWKKSLRTGEPYEIEYRLRHRSGSYRWVLDRALPIRDEEGKIIRWMGTCTDIHDIRETENELKKALASRDEFLSIASHELKTPLTALRLNSQIMRRELEKKVPEGTSTEKVSEYVDQTLRQSERLNRLVDDMLDLSRIRTGKLSVYKDPTDLVELLRELKGRIDAIFLEKTGKELALRSPSTLTIHLDRTRIEQVLNNLLTNALRYGRGKPVEIEVSESGNEILVKVIDQGVGIPADKIQLIFERFERGDVSANEVSGLGLGLFITRQIVEAHGGKIWVDSVPQQGTVFSFTLPKNLIGT